MPIKIAVIMSTFNGEKYLTEQIDSILHQSNVFVELFIRDDGSTDQTCEILQQYELQYPNIHVNYGQNIGFRQSFIQELLKHPGFEYYSFSDQDDFWNSEKLFSACNLIEEQMKNQKRPAVYYSNLNIADAQLNVYRKTKLEKRHQSLESIIMRRSIAGCTMVVNEEMWKLLASKRITDSMLRRGHDSFLLTLCYSLGGSVFCDGNAFILYRQHSDNTSGSSNGLIRRIKKEWNVLLNKKGQESEIAKAILETWPNAVIPEAQKTLTMVSNYRHKIGYRLFIVLSKKFSTGEPLLTFLGKFKALVGLL